MLEVIVNGYNGSVYAVRRHIRSVRPVSKHEAFFRLTVLPGEQAQVDWGSFGKLQVGRGERKLSCFVLVLAWSRATFARFTLDQTLESFVRGHVEAFERLGGVPRAILYDNLKSVVLERQGDLIRFHPRILDVAGHYHFAPTPVAVARGNEKPRVERRIRDIRESFFAARSYSSLEDLNQKLDHWIESVVHQRKVPGDDAMTVQRALAEERNRLLPLPEHPLQAAYVKTVRSGKTPYIRFDRNDYSIPHTHVRKPLSLIASDTTVRLLDGQLEIARHARSWSIREQIENPTHLEELALEKRKAREHRGRNRLTENCPHAFEFLSEVAVRGGHLGSTTSRLIRLLDRYGATDLDAAIDEAQQRGAIAAQSVAHILDQLTRSRGNPTPIEFELPDDPRVRDLTVTPHKLEKYDELGRDTESTKTRSEGDNE